MSNDHGGGGGIVKARESTTERKTQATGKKRGNSIFATMSVAPANDEDEDDDDGDREGDVGSGGNRNLRVCHAERVLVNGDFYTGQWADKLPHGLGKYLWTDGCMYVGEWSRGKTTGKGCFTWPSGATYEGEFKSGYMDGKGTYTGSSGDTYRGGWIMNLKHGQGTKSYVNGDCYDGEWRRGVQEGHGRYQWRRGNHYIGHWKGGAIHGNGTMIWTNGNRFDGSWEDGLPRGNGTLRWADGSFYVGVWSTDPKEQTGTYYPPGSSVAANSDWDPQEIFSVELRDCRICPGDNITILPSQKTLTWPGFEGDLTPPPHHHHQQQRRRDLSKEAVKDSSHRPRRRSVDGRISLGTERGCHGWDSDDIAGGRGDLYGRHSTATCLPGSITSLLSEDSESNRGGGRQPLRIQPTKKQGETISKGHKNYELMLNLQLGIRHSVGRPAPATSLDLKASAFDPKEKVWTKFPPEGSKHTPPHQSCDFRWKDYCPLVFRTLRKLFEVDAADYMLSICGNDALRELSSPGKSGSFFYLTNDDQYMIKTMKKAEVKVLLRMLPAYYNHVRAYEHTLVTKFFGLHCVKLTGTAQKKVRFVIMGNLFCTDYAIHRRFDLKGSSHGRTTDKPDAELDATTTLKDLDLNFIFRLQKDWFQELCRQVDKDCDFLEQERIMDYSLLVGLHFRELVETSPVEGSRSGARTPAGNGNSEGDVAPPPRLSVSQLPFDPARWATKRLGINMAARVEQTIRRNDYEQLVGEPTGELYEVILFFGIIDILQDYDISKKLEHAYKSIQYDPTSISAVDPRQYSKRFRDFVFKVFAEDT